MAIIALVGAWVFPPLGIVFGHIALAQLRRTDEAGKGLAIAGLVIGYVWTVLVAVGLAIAVMMGAFSKDTVPTSTRVTSTAFIS